MTLTTNAGANDGSQIIRVAKGGSVGEVTVKLIADTVYVNGASFALSSYMGFTTTAASNEANRWLSLPHSKPDFSAVAAGLTVGSTTSELEMTGPVTSVGDSVILGEQVVGLKGESKPQTGEPRFTTVLYVKAQGPTLPVEETQTYNGATAVISLGHWNEPISLKTPSDAIALETSWLR